MRKLVKLKYAVVVLVARLQDLLDLGAFFDLELVPLSKHLLDKQLERDCELLRPLLVVGEVYFFLKLVEVDQPVFVLVDVLRH